MLELEEKKLVAVSVNELRKHPGHSVIIGLAEDGMDLWKAFRKPDGTFWHITATVSFIPETLRVETAIRFSMQRCSPNLETVLT
jgi:hypothetical protein